MESSSQLLEQQQKKKKRREELQSDVSVVDKLYKLFKGHLPSDTQSKVKGSRKPTGPSWASQLKVTVLEGRNLAEKNSIAGGSDAYVTLTLGSKEFKTPYIPKLLNPVWDASFTILLEKADMRRSLVVTVWDYDLVLQHAFMGQVVIPMNSSLFPIKGWFPLKDRGRLGEEVAGEIHLAMKMQFTAHEEELQMRRRAVLQRPIAKAAQTPVPSSANAQSARNRGATAMSPKERIDALRKSGVMRMSRNSLPNVMQRTSARERHRVDLHLEEPVAAEEQKQSQHEDTVACVNRDLAAEFAGEWLSITPGDDKGKEEAHAAQRKEVTFAVSPVGNQSAYGDNAVSEDSGDGGNVVSESSAGSGDGGNVVSEDSSVGGNVVSEDSAGSGDGGNVVSEDSSVGGNVVSEDSGDRGNVVSEDSAGSGDGGNVVSEDSGDGGNVVSEDSAGSGDGGNVVSEDSGDGVNIVSEDFGDGGNVVSEDSSVGGNVVSEDSAGSGDGGNVVSEDSGDGGNVVSEDSAGSGDGGNVVSEDSGDGGNVVSEDSAASGDGGNIVSEDSGDGGNVVSEDSGDGGNVVSVDSSDGGNIVSEDSAGSGDGGNVVSSDDSNEPHGLWGRWEDRLEDREILEADIQEFQRARRNHSNLRVASSSIGSSPSRSLRSSSVPSKHSIVRVPPTPSRPAVQVPTIQFSPATPQPRRESQTQLSARGRLQGDTSEDLALSPIAHVVGGAAASLNTNMVRTSSRLTRSYDDAYVSESETSATYQMMRDSLVRADYAAMMGGAPRPDPTLGLPKGKKRSSSTSKRLTVTIPDITKDFSEDGGRESPKKAKSRGASSTHLEMENVGGGGHSRANSNAPRVFDLSNIHIRVTGTAVLQEYDAATNERRPVGRLVTAVEEHNAPEVPEDRSLKRAQPAVTMEKVSKYRHQTLNERFQEAMSLLREASDSYSANPLEMANAFARVIHIAQDFLHVAKTYGRIIITERWLSYEKKTIKPKDQFGGRAGGEKYMIQGILFKFAIDSNGLFRGSDAAAAKVAGHELRGLVSYFNCGVPQLHYPLMCLLDYKGYRLICLSFLPLEKGSLIYGSCDAGKTVMASDPQFNEHMKKAAANLHLAGALRGLKDGITPPRMLHAAVDIEGHLGTDGRYYMLDFSRAFPCEAPRHRDERQPGEHLYRLLRPEFVTAYPKALCSDAYSRFLECEPKRREMHKDIKIATAYLKETVIPEFAQTLADVFLQADLLQNGITDFPYSTNLHAKGINVRHTGLLASHVRLLRHQYATELNRYLLVEMTTRVLKAIYRQKLRDTMERYKVPLEQPYIEVVVAFLNQVFGRTRSSEEYWDAVIRPHLIAKFGSCALPARGDVELRRRVMDSKLSKNYHLVGSKLLFLKLQKCTGFTLSQLVLQKIKNKPRKFFRQHSPFEQFHLLELGELIKTIDVINHCQANYLLVKGTSNNKPRDALQILRRADRLFVEILSAIPNNAYANRQYAYCLTHEARLQERLEKEKAQKNRLLMITDLASNPKMHRALSFYKRSLELDPTDKVTMLYYAKALEMTKDFYGAEDFFLKALEIDPDYLAGLKEYALFLAGRGRKDLAVLFTQRMKKVIGSLLTSAISISMMRAVQDRAQGESSSEDYSSEGPPD